MINPDTREELKKELSDSPEKQKQLDQFGSTTLEMINSKTGRRFIKSHLPYSLLPPDLITKGCKVSEINIVNRIFIITTIIR